MALDNPYFVYGTITDGGSPVNSAHVYVRDTTLGSTILNMTTSSNGQYIIDIEDIATNGDTIKVWSYGPTGKYIYSTFVLDISGPNQKADLAITTFTLSETGIYLEI